MAQIMTRVLQIEQPYCTRDQNTRSTDHRETKSEKALIIRPYKKH